MNNYKKIKKKWYEINKPVTISNIEFIKLYGFLEWLRWMLEECQK